MREVKIVKDGTMLQKEKDTWHEVACPVMRPGEAVCNIYCAWYHEETGVAQGIDAKMVAMCGEKVIGVIKGV